MHKSRNSSAVEKLLISRIFCRPQSWNHSCNWS